VKHEVSEQLRGVLSFVGAIWAIYFAGLVAPIDIHRFGITPRTATALLGIPLARRVADSFGWLTRTVLASGRRDHTSRRNSPLKQYFIKLLELRLVDFAEPRKC
jgi:hypothetical protein